MSTLRFFATNPIKAKKIKLSVGSRCEICDREMALDDLEIHTFINGADFERTHLPSLERFLLVLCSWCHWDLHAFDVTTADQEKLVEQRCEAIRQEIRKILAYISKSYTPPDTDLEQFFLEAKQVDQLIFGV